MTPRRRSWSPSRSPATGFSPAQIYRRRADGVVTVYADFAGGSGGQGSGFVVSPAGSVLTSAHVVTTAGLRNGAAIKPAGSIFVQFSDGDRAPARIVGYDLFDDVAVLHVDPKLHPLDPVPLGDSDRVVVGEPVAAIGSPFGDTGSLSVGVVSAIRRTLPSVTKYALYDAIQTDAPINHGNSGGPLLDARGRVIGINAQITSSGGPDSGSEGVGFAVPIDAAKRSLAQLLATGQGRLRLRRDQHRGSDAVRSRSTSATRPGRAPSSARSSREVALRSPGLKAGSRIEPFEGLDVPVGGDAIVAINGIPVGSAEDVVRIVASRLLPGQTARFTVVRGKERRVVPVTLGARRPPG